MSVGVTRAVLLPTIRQVNFFQFILIIDFMRKAPTVFRVYVPNIIFFTIFYIRFSELFKTVNV